MLLLRIFVGVAIDTNLDGDLFSVPALLEGFEIRESISFIEEHINRQVCLNIESQSDTVTGKIQIILCLKNI